MIFIKWLLLAPISLIGGMLAYFANYWACRHLDADGNLIYLRKWLQPPDMAELWGPNWAASIAGLTKQQAVLMYLKRNPGQGLDNLLRANVTMQTPCNTYGNIRIGDTAGKAGWYLITCSNAFHFAWIIPIGFGKCIEGGMGWRLNNIVLEYPHPTMGQIISTPFRFFKFGV